MKILSQSTTIILSSITVFIILNTPLLPYLTPILALLIIFSVIYIIIKKRSKDNKELLSGSGLEVFGVFTAVLLIIFATGGITSSVFFLVYFLLFGLAFLFEPVVVLIFAICISAIFFEPTFKDDVFSNLIKSGSVIFLSPIAYFFGREFKRNRKLEEKIEQASDEIIEDADALLHSESATRKEEDLEEIDDIMKQANALKRETEK